MAEVMFEQEWFTGTRIKHPLAAPDTAKAMMARHSTGDSTTVLKRITGWTQELMALPDVALPERFAVLDLLDRHAKNHQINLIPEYLETAHLRKLTEGALWTSSFDFWKTIGEAYQACLDQYPANQPADLAQEYILPMLVGRIIRSLALEFKWALLRHQRLDEKFWRDIGRTYLFAESHDFAARRVAVYASRHGESSARTELLKILMLAVSSPEALAPAQQHIAERLVAHFGERFVLSERPNSACSFAFDLASGKAPGRVGETDGTPLLLRHFGPGDALEGLPELAGYLHRNGTLPPYINIGLQMAPHQIDAVLRHLGRTWGDEPPARHFERQRQTSELTVVPGLSENVRWLERMMAAGSIAVDRPELAEHWQASDSSENGCGAIAPPNPGDWLEIGSLIGMHSESAASYRMGVVRRLIRQHDDTHQVGLELLGDAAAPVAIFPAAAMHADDPERPGEAAVLVSLRPDEHGTIELISRAAGVTQAKALQMRFRGRVHKIELEHVIEQTSAYRRARYRLL